MSYVEPSFQVSENQKNIEQLRSLYPAGTKIRLIEMKDPYPIPPQTTGVVKAINAIGMIDLKWEYPSSLRLVPGIDVFEIIE